MTIQQQQLKPKAVNEENLDALVGGVLHDLGGAFSVPLVQIGESLGIYQTLDENGPLSSGDLAAKTGLNERYLREWLSAQAASKYVTYDPVTETFSMTPEQAFVFANPGSPFYLAPAFGAAAAFQHNMTQVKDAFRTGVGVAWGDQTQCLSCAVARFFRPGYHNHLINSWLPSIDGIVGKLEQGGEVADIGCGHGLSTLIMAQETGAALGAQAGEKRLRKLIVEEAGFGSFRRATETPFNLILEARP